MAVLEEVSATRVRDARTCIGQARQDAVVAASKLASGASHVRHPVIVAISCDTRARRLSASAWYFFFQAEDGIRGHCVTGVQTCALPIYSSHGNECSSPWVTSRSKGGCHGSY